jgi:hypothetical protein
MQGDIRISADSSLQLNLPVRVTFYSNKWASFNGKGTLEASLNELGITDLEDEKSFSSQISLPTSMMSSMDLWT